MAGEILNNLIAGATLGKVGDEGMTVIMPAPLNTSFRADIAPSRFE
jgi:hypothetical protein